MIGFKMGKYFWFFVGCCSAFGFCDVYAGIYETDNANNRLYLPRITVHPAYNPFLQYRNSYTPEPHRLNAIHTKRAEPTKDRNLNGVAQSGKYHSSSGEFNDELNNGYNEDVTAIDQGNYKEYIHSEPSLDPRRHDFQTRQTVSTSGKFKDMKTASNRAPIKDAPLQTQPRQVNNQRDACHFMQKMHLSHYIGQYGFDMMCRMYKQWGENMKSESDWQPTEEQRVWFESLGSRSRKTGRKLQHRSKRQIRENKALRKEYRTLSDEERFRLHRALNILKRTSMDGMSTYELFVQSHSASRAPAAHFGPAFLGFHREFLLRFENALREIDPSVSIPYWDSNLDHLLGDDIATHSILWSPSFLGNGVGDVIEGPFAYWRFQFPAQSGNSRLLHRNLTVAPEFARTMPALMPDQAIIDFLDSKQLRNTSWFVNPVFESHHGAVHNWVGGVMADIPISPADPVFFLHHAFLDCLWEQMREEQRQRDVTFDPQYDYPNDSIALGVGMEQPDGTILRYAQESYHHPLAPMHPFAPLRNIDGLSNIYTDEFYSCQPSPVCTPTDTSCNSPYLFCDRSTYRCAPKLQIDTTCVDFDGSDPCMDGVCCNGVCRIDCNGVSEGDRARSLFTDDKRGFSSDANGFQERPAHTSTRDRNPSLLEDQYKHSSAFTSFDNFRHENRNYADRSPDDRRRRNTDGNLFPPLGYFPYLP